MLIGTVLSFALIRSAFAGDEDKAYALVVASATGGVVCLSSQLDRNNATDLRLLSDAVASVAIMSGDQSIKPYEDWATKIVVKEMEADQAKSCAENRKWLDRVITIARRDYSAMLEAAWNRR